MKKTIRFWTEKELKSAKTCLDKFNTVKDAADWLAPRINRPTGAVMVKLFSLQKTGNFSAERKKREPKAKPEGVNLPKGFSFDFTPSRAEMHDDHVRLFF